MSSSSYVSNASITAPSYTGTNSTLAFVGDASGLTLGTNTGYIVTTNGSNQLTTEQFVPLANGGLNTNVASLSSGVLTTNGTTISSVAFGLSGNNTLVETNSSGNVNIGSGSITANNITANGIITGNGSGLTNLNVSAAEITVGTNPGWIVTTNGSNQLTTEQYVPVANGGFGVNPTSGLSSTTSAGSALVVSSGALATFSYATAATANTLAQRDSNGALTATSFLQSANANALSSSLTAYVQTTNATATTLLTLPTSTGITTGSKGSVYLIYAQIAVGDATGEVNSAVYVLDFKAKNVYNGTSNVLTVSAPISIQTTIDTGMSLTTSSVTVSSSSQNVIIQVTGIASTTLNWSGAFYITQAIY